MLEVILNKHIIYVLMGVFTVLGILSKLIVGISLRRMVYAAGNMSKSTHPLMRLIRAKFEHACMVSEKVENVRVFVEKYLYEYRVFGVKLHSFRRMEMTAAGMCLILAVAGTAMEYSVHGLTDEMVSIGVTGVVLGVLVLLVHFVTDENYRLEAVRNYMVDYLENICLHRYEKAYQRENVAAVRNQENKAGDKRGERPAENAVERAEEKPVENLPERVVEKVTVKAAEAPPEAQRLPKVPVPEFGAVTEEAVRPVKQEKPVYEAKKKPEAMMAETAPERVAPAKKLVKKEKKEESKDILIRQILEEFMA